MNFGSLNLTTSNNYRNLKTTYSNGIGVNIGDNLIKTCLADCSLYRRGTAFFSSTSLKSYADLISDLIEKEVKLEILCSPVIQDKNLIKILEKNSTEDQRELIRKEAENIVLDAVGGFQENPNNVDFRSKVLSYMIAKGQLEVKFAIPKNYETLPIDGNYDPIYHVKNGYFDFPNGDRVVFAGSFNESRLGHVGNKEFTTVYKSWIDGHKEFLEPIEEIIDKEWNKEKLVLDDLEIYPLGEEILKIIRELAPPSIPTPKPDLPVSPAVDEFPLWDHQIKAIDAFLKATELDPKNIDAIYRLGGIYNYQKNYNKAVQSFKNVIKLDPTHFNARYSLGFSYEQLGKPELAKIEFDRYHSLKKRFESLITKD